MTDPTGDTESNGTSEHGKQHESGLYGDLSNARGLADGDQTLADSDQTASDTDQSASDLDQGTSDDDQEASERDQKASDLDFAEGGNKEVHETSRDLRDESALQRRRNSEKRTEVAALRDSVADARDLAADLRDQAAAVFDLELEEQDAKRGITESGKASPEARASANRLRASEDRASAAEARVRAAKDREEAKKDRLQSANDRAEACKDRKDLMRAIAKSETDALTGVRSRAPGLADLEHEIEKTRRQDGELSVAYIDVVGLKTVNDRYGHLAGDGLLVEVVRTIREHLRSYDIIIRVGGDKFVCVMSGVDEQHARGRFDRIQAVLGAEPCVCRVRVGTASLEPLDSAAEIIGRADALLTDNRN